MCMLLNQQVVGAIDQWHDQGHEKQDNSWQLSHLEVVGVEVHRGSVLTPLLLIVMQEALITEFRTDCT